jgi:hypothetical protein
MDKVPNNGGEGDVLTWRGKKKGEGMVTDCARNGKEIQEKEGK